VFLQDPLHCHPHFGADVFLAPQIGRGTGPDHIDQFGRDDSEVFVARQDMGSSIRPSNSDWKLFRSEVPENVVH
jgi:hypothetical protein